MKEETEKIKLEILLVSKDKREQRERLIQDKMKDQDTEVCYIFEKGRRMFYVP